MDFNYYLHRTYIVYGNALLIVKFCVPRRINLTLSTDY